MAPYINAMPINKKPVAKEPIRKYLMLSLAVGSGHLWLVIIAIGTSVIGVFYYFKIIMAMYFKKGNDDQFPLVGNQKLLQVILLILMFVAGIFPDIFQLLK